LFTWIAKLADEAIAWYLDEHVRAGYKFLMQNYRTGDKVCLFGFSRGAYTARALAGFLHKIGLLPRDNDEQIAFAYSLYKRTDKVGDKLARDFKQTFCADMNVDFLGVWDTVASVGLIYGRSLPFATVNSAVKVFRHALSLDEHRARFQPNLFHYASPDEAAEGTEDQGSPDLANPTPGPPAPPPDVQEVWFVGCHSDVGGGVVDDGVEYSLANISLRWMVKQVTLSRCGIKFDTAALKRRNIDIPTVILAGPAQQTVERQDVEPQSLPQGPDVLTPIHDELKTQPLWWILEFIPMRFNWQLADKRWTHKWAMNLGRGRQIRSDPPVFHESVLERINDVNLKYKPKARWTPGTEKYVT